MVLFTFIESGFFSYMVRCQWYLLFPMLGAILSTGSNGTEVVTLFQIYMKKIFKKALFALILNLKLAIGFLCSVQLHKYL